MRIAEVVLITGVLVALSSFLAFTAGRDMGFREAASLTYSICKVAR